MKKNISTVAAVLSKWHIKESQYAVYAGFDESLVKAEVGYLEQIHVFTTTGVDANSPLLSALGQIFSPFHAILFTKSSSHQIPVFKDDGSAWDFDELVFSRAMRFVETGSTVAMLSTRPSLARSTPKDNAAGVVAQGSTEEGEEQGDRERREKGDAGANSNEDNKQDDDGRREEGDAGDDNNRNDEQDDGGRQEERDAADDNNGNDEEGDDGRQEEGDAGGDNNGNNGDSPGVEPEEPTGNNKTNAKLPPVSFEVLTVICGGDKFRPKDFQTLKMEGEVTIKVCPWRCHLIVSCSYLVSRQSPPVKIAASMERAKSNLQSWYSIALDLRNAPHTSNTTSA